MNELREVLSSAQASAQRVAPAGEDSHVVSTRSRIRRRRFARQAGAGLAGVVVLAGVAAATVWLPGVLRESPVGVPSPAPTDSQEPEPSLSPSPNSPGFVERAVTVIPGVLPEAQALTEAVLDQVSSGWVLLSFDGTVMDGENPTQETGPWVTYLVTPTGERFEVGVSETEATIVQWDVSGQTAWLQGGQRNSVAQVLDLRTGEMQPVDLECRSGEFFFESVAVIDSGWLVRHRCDEVGVAVVVDPHGASYVDVLDDLGVFVGEEGVTVRDLDGTQAVYTYGVAPEQEFRVEGFDGVSQPLLLPPGFNDCYPHGPGRANALAVQCLDGGAPTVWDLSLTGGAAAAVVDAPARERLATAVGHPGLGEAVMVPYYCTAGEVPVLVVDGLERPAAVALGSAATVVGYPDGSVEQCNSGTGDRVLLSGYGTVWTVNVVTNEVTVLVAPPTRDATTYVAGAHALAAIMAP
jgi:hypothetical protein